MHIEIDEGIRSILIVEDEMIVAMLMEQIVRELGVDNVHLCTDAASALDIVASHAIDLAVLDMQVRDGTTDAVAWIPLEDIGAGRVEVTDAVRHAVANVAS